MQIDDSYGLNENKEGVKMILEGMSKGNQGSKTILFYF